MPIPQLPKKTKPAPKPGLQHKTRQFILALKQRSNPKLGDGKPRKKWKKWLKRILITLAILTVLGLAFAAGAFLWLSRELPDPNRISETTAVNSIKFYDRTGQILLYEKGDIIQQPVDYPKVPNYLKWATISLEDRKFYEHHGVSLIGITRAAINNALGRNQYTSGGSTLTQQLIKNTIVGSEKNYTRKIKEAVLSLELERKFSKEQILELYFNRVYYGRFHMGVASAAREYFNKDISELTLTECATLASIPRNPPTYLSNPDLLKARRDYAIDIMVEEGYIATTEAEAAKQEPLADLYESTGQITAPHFVFYVNDLLIEKYGALFIQQGLKVTTTLDLDKQTKAETAIANGLPKIEQYGGSNAGLVSIDAKTGQVLAMVGSKNFFAEDYDGQVNVTNSLRQPGSSFKPIVYLAAFIKGYSPETKVWDVETDFATDTGNYRPRNFDGGTRGLISLRSALGQSLNIPAVKTLYLVGLNKALDTAEALGYTSLSDRSRFGLALVLGGGEVTLIEHTSTYATFAREGEHHPVAAILKIEDQSGKTLEEWQDQPEQVVEQKAVRILNSVLSDQGVRVGFSALNLKDRPTAAKTGTTNDFRDAWTMGYTPSLATGVWVGNNDNSKMKSMGDGIVIAAPIWNDYMTQALSGTPVETFNKPEKLSGIEGAREEEIIKKVDKYTQKLIPDDCLNTYPTEYISDKTFKQGHTILYYLNKENPAGKAPADPAQDPQYNNWEAAVQKYFTDLPDYLPTDETTLQYEDCALRDPSKNPTVKISLPFDNASVSKKDLVLQAKITPGEGRTVVKVDFIIDTITVDSQQYSANSRTTFTSDYSPNTLTEGKHTLTVIAYDNKQNQTQDLITFTYLGKSK